MMKRIIAVILFALLLASPAYARGHHHHAHHHRHHHTIVVHSFQEGLGHGLAHMMDSARPHAWCGWYMRREMGVSDPAYNLARNWAHYGSTATGPAPGVIGVMPHHVFRVIEVVGPDKVLAISGNDGGAVRTRVRSTRGVIAWRQP